MSLRSVYRKDKTSIHYKQIFFFFAFHEIHLCSEGRSLIDIPHFPVLPSQLSVYILFDVLGFQLDGII